MITLKNIKTLSGDLKEHTIESAHSQVIDGQGKLLMLPAFIDVDAPFNHQEWTKQALSFISWGISTIFEAAGEKPEVVKKQQEALQDLFKTGKTPLRLHCFLDGNDPKHFQAIEKTKSYTLGIKTDFNLNKVPIEAPHTTALARLFQIAAQENRIVAIALMQGQGSAEEQKKTALNAVEKCIGLAEKYSTQLCLQHLRTQEEMRLVRGAKKAGILVYAEISYPHLLLTSKDSSQTEKTSFLPSPADQEALWEAINDRTIDLIGSGTFLGQPELFVASLVDAAQRNKMHLDNIVSLTRQNVENIFSLRPNKDIVLIDTTLASTPSSKSIQQKSLAALLKNRTFEGWPVFTIVNGEIFPSGMAQ